MISWGLASGNAFVKAIKSKNRLEMKFVFSPLSSLIPTFLYIFLGSAKLSLILWITILVAVVEIISSLYYVLYKKLD